MSFCDQVCYYSGRIVAAPESLCNQLVTRNSRAIPDACFPTGNILSFAFSAETGRLAVTAENKQVTCWDVSTWERVSNRIAIKRANCVSFAKNGSKLLIGDKFGDVYSITPDDEAAKEALILGHVSMLTAMTMSKGGDYVLTADRDEKVRVSRYPLAFDIIQFCLGHKEFISALHIPSFAPHLLISGGGDPFLLSWDYHAGKILQTIPLVAQGSNAEVTVTSIISHPKSKIVAVTLEGSSSVLLFSAQDPTAVVQLPTLELASTQHSVAFDSPGNLWIAADPVSPTSPLLLLVARIGADGRTFSAPQLSGDAVSSNTALTNVPPVAALPDLAFRSKLRKLPQGQHHPVFAEKARKMAVDKEKKAAIKKENVEKRKLAQQERQESKKVKIAETPR
ncbi:WD repeat-containing protein 4 [Thoreauomyces humboldtii]|nr:WD repeat-containing protein 4 [Thoreauomyces humboldtii]